MDIVNISNFLYTWQETNEIFRKRKMFDITRTILRRLIISSHTSWFLRRRPLLNRAGNPCSWAVELTPSAVAPALPWLVQTPVGPISHPCQNWDRPSTSSTHPPRKATIVYQTVLRMEVIFQTAEQTNNGRTQQILTWPQSFWSKSVIILLSSSVVESNKFLFTLLSKCLLSAFCKQRSRILTFTGAKYFYRPQTKFGAR